MVFAENTQNRVFSNLRTLLKSGQFVEFARLIQPLLKESALPNKDVFEVLLHDALDLVRRCPGHGAAEFLEQVARESLIDKPKQPESSFVPAHERRPEAPLATDVIQLRRVVQVTSYGRAGFRDTDSVSIRRTVYRSPQERTFHSAVQLRYPGLFALPNYPIASVLNTDWLRPLVSRRMFAFAVRSTLDVLLVTPGEGDPILGFELDSAWHDGEVAKERDELKDKILRLANIPLIRLRVPNSETMTNDDWYAVLSDQVGDVPVPRRHRCRTEAPTFVPF